MSTVLSSATPALREHEGGLREQPQFPGIPTTSDGAGMVEHLEDRTANSSGGKCEGPEEDVAHVVDTGQRDHSFEVLLNHCDYASVEHREQPKSNENRREEF